MAIDGKVWKARAKSCCSLRTAGLGAPGAHPQAPAPSKVPAKRPASQARESQRARSPRLPCRERTWMPSPPPGLCRWRRGCGSHPRRSSSRSQRWRGWQPRSARKEDTEVRAAAGRRRAPACRQGWECLRGRRGGRRGAFSALRRPRKGCPPVWGFVPACEEALGKAWRDPRTGGGWQQGAEPRLGLMSGKGRPCDSWGRQTGWSQPQLQVLRSWLRPVLPSFPEALSGSCFCFTPQHRMTTTTDRGPPLHPSGRTFWKGMCHWPIRATCSVLTPALQFLSSATGGPTTPAPAPTLAPAPSPVLLDSSAGIRAPGIFTHSCCAKSNRQSAQERNLLGITFPKGEML